MEACKKPYGMVKKAKVKAKVKHMICMMGGKAVKAIKSRKKSKILSKIVQSELFELGCGVYKVYMAHKLLPATVPLKTQIIKNLLHGFSFGNPGLKLLPEVRYGLATAPASYWNYHIFTLVISKKHEKVRQNVLLPDTIVHMLRLNHL